MKKVEKTMEPRYLFVIIARKNSSDQKLGGYDTYWRHVDDKYPTKVVRSKSRGQTQIARHASPNNQLFRYSYVNNIEELACIVVVEHLPFNFCEKVDFVNYCQRTLNHVVCLVHIQFFIFIKKEKRYDKFF